MRTAMTYRDVIDHGEIVWSETRDVFVTWNRSATFNVWCRDEGDSYLNTDCFTNYSADSVRSAREIARDFFAVGNVTD